ncbi:hypothetical protein P7C70_g7681, partial [Phenoliferia sp. Uapishka_3]
MSASQDDFTIGTAEFDFNIWCQSLGISTEDPPILPLCFPENTPSLFSTAIPTPALEFSASTTSSELESLVTPSDSFLNAGPMPFQVTGNQAEAQEANFVDFQGLFGRGPWHGARVVDGVTEGLNSCGYESPKKSEERGKEGAVSPGLTSRDDEAGGAKRRTRRKTVPLYNGTGFSQNKERILARKKEEEASDAGAASTPLPADPKLRKREINRLASEASRARKRGYVQMLEERIRRLEGQVRQAGLVPVE